MEIQKRITGDSRELCCPDVWTAIERFQIQGHFASFDFRKVQRGVYPPIAGLPSLSRLMKDGVGCGYTREDRPTLASQLFAGYAYVKRARGLADVIGEEELSPLDKQYLNFGEALETRFLNQGEYENRSNETTLELGGTCFRGCRGMSCIG